MAMSVCIGVSSFYDGSETGKKPTESVSISMIPMQSMDVVQTATLVLPGVLENTIDHFRQRKHTTASYAL